jgi:hypothetical protein
MDNEGVLALAKLHTVKTITTTTTTRRTTTKEKACMLPRFAECFSC